MSALQGGKREVKCDEGNLRTAGVDLESGGDMVRCKSAGVEGVCEPHEKKNIDEVVTHSSG